MLDQSIHESEIQPKSFIGIVESVRGIAAIYVVVSHVLVFLNAKTLFPTDSVFYFIISMFYNYGHEAVLLFFIVSGFSIHYTSMDRPLNGISGILYYYYLRLRRIYPIFLIIVIITIALVYIGYVLNLSGYDSQLKSLSINQIIWTLLFATDRDYIEGFFVATIPSNGPLWSLSYEILYYLMYPIFWIISTKRSILSALLVSAIISIIAIIYSILFTSNHLTNVMSLYILWGLGAFIAELKRKNLKFTISPVYLYFAIYILVESVWVLEYVRHSFFSLYQIIWGLLFFCLMLLFFFQKKITDTALSTRIILTALMLFGLVINLNAPSYINITDNKIFYILKILSSFCILLLFIYTPKICIQSIIRKVLSPFNKLGHISYGLYICHFPILSFFSALIISYGIPKSSYILAAAISFLLAYILEIKYQHQASSLLDRFIKPIITIK